MPVVKQKLRDQSLKKFQDLLRELFQFDCADLDFGIYRIMNYKRDAIEGFINDELPQAIKEELQRGDLADRAQTAKNLKDAHARVLKDLGETAVNADGNLDKRFRETPIGKEYLLLKAQADYGLSREALETNIFNHLYSFFSRYYEYGDYISKRRYSRQQRYAIPYNGEEVYLHWANSDQYYIKTAEHFHDYSYKAPNGVTVHFKLKAADVEQNNVKGDKRFFLPRSKETVWNDKNREIVIPFEYRPLTSQESINYGKRKQQDVIIGATLEEVPKSLKVPPDVLAALMGERRVDSDGQTITFLEHHLRHYTRRNTSDFFIHKDLKGFLSRELDFYLKNEVLNLDDMEVAGEDHAEGWFQTMRAIRSVASRIIGFLDQIESFQKMLWEKRKFITETRYCITLGHIHESFYPDIAMCQSQWLEWKLMFQIDKQAPELFNLRKKKKARRINFLKDHPTLVLDTQHFDNDFVDRLLSSIDSLDDKTDGLLIQSENFQALAFLREKYHEKIQCVSIDPPYNTDNNDFIYKDSYRHSSWLGMMKDRINLSRVLLTPTGSHYCQIDTNESFRLAIMLNTAFKFQREIIWDTQVLSGYKTLAENWIRGHETIFFHTKNQRYLFNKQKQPHRKEYLDRFDKQDENGRWYFDGRGEILYKDEVIKKGKAVGDVWYDIMSFQQQPTSRERVDFDTQKPEELIERMIKASSHKGDWILDYFLGSGTTLATAIMLGRRAIGVDMAASDLLLTTLPRLKEVLYGKQTEVSKKEQYNGGGILKYICLESYEDSLNNIEFDDSAGQHTFKFDDYLIQYMLQWETKQSTTFLNIEKISRPFSYKLFTHSDGETRETLADIPETFNYLLGLQVSTRRVYSDSGHRYLVYKGKNREESAVTVIWRETEGWKKTDYTRDRDFVAKLELTVGADQIFVNGDSLIPNARALEPLFKSRMFAGVDV